MKEGVGGVWCKNHFSYKSQKEYFRCVYSKFRLGVLYNTTTGEYSKKGEKQNKKIR